MNAAELPAGWLPEGPDDPEDRACHVPHDGRRGEHSRREHHQSLGIDEVWLDRGRLEVHALRGDSYDRVARSGRLPRLDLDLVCSFLDRRSVHIARRDFREARRTRPEIRYRYGGKASR